MHNNVLFLAHFESSEQASLTGMNLPQDSLLLTSHLFPVEPLTVSPQPDQHLRNKSDPSRLSCFRQIVGLLWIYLLPILVESDPRRWCTIAAPFPGANTGHPSRQSKNPRGFTEEHTEQSCREWHTRRSIGASNTFLGQRIRERQRHQRYHLIPRFMR